MKSNMVTFLKNHPMPDLQDLEIVSSAPLYFFLNPPSEASQLASQYGFQNLFSIQREFTLGRIPRQRLNCILRKLPMQVARLIRGSNILDVESTLALTYLSNQCDLLSTKFLKIALLEQKCPNLAVDLNKIYRRQNLPSIGTDSLVEHFNKLWQIKHPVLRAIRLKLCYKNVFSNERRFRFGISDSPLCSNCGQIETIEHQLFECPNAKRLWLMFKDIIGTEIVSFSKVLTCSLSVEAEILKASIIKALLQINRNHNVPTKTIAQECAYLIRIEAIVNLAKRSRLMVLVSKLNNVS